MNFSFQKNNNNIESWGLRLAFSKVDHDSIVQLEDNGWKSERVLIWVCNRNWEFP